MKHRSRVEREVRLRRRALPNSYYSDAVAKAFPKWEKRAGRFKKTRTTAFSSRNERGLCEFLSRLSLSLPLSSGCGCGLLAPLASVWALAENLLLCETLRETRV